MRFLVEIADDQMMAYTSRISLLHKVLFRPQDCLKYALEDQIQPISITTLGPDDRITCRPLAEI